MLPITRECCLALGSSLRVRRLSLEGRDPGSNMAQIHFPL